MLGDLQLHVSAGRRETSPMPREQVLERIFAFLDELGLALRLESLPGDTFLPGIRLVSGGMVVDLARLRFPGDLLHEAGHLAVMSPADRAAAFPQPADAGEEMAAMAWSYAAAVHLGIPAEEVFHPAGYRGGAGSILEQFTKARPGSVTMGVPLLSWMGMTPQQNAVDAVEAPFPAMRKWLRA